MKIQLKDKSLSLDKTLVMGILNITQDSFSDGGQWFGNVDKAVGRVEQMLEEGADIIDVGGESTRPGSERISVSEERKRVIPVIKKIRKILGDKIIISIDTYKAAVAKEAVENGADIINEVSGLQLDKKMPSIVARFDVPVIINHMRGSPKTMQQGEIKYDDVISEINKFFKEKIDLLQKNGVKKDRIILDPGFGFGKLPSHNLEILNRLSEFSIFKLPILIGVSRKNTLGVILKESLGKDFAPKERVDAGLAAAAVAILNGANIVRTHDVWQTKQFFAVFDKIRSSKAL